MDRAHRDYVHMHMYMAVIIPLNLFSKKCISYVLHGYASDSPSLPPPHTHTHTHTHTHSRDMLTSCWMLNPDKRPTFSEIMSILDNQLSAAHVSRETSQSQETGSVVHNS